MRALVLPRPGLEELRITDVPVPEPGPGQVRLRVEACGLNPVDAGLAGGTRPEWARPHILGLDTAGTVDAVGIGVDAWRTGDRVACHGDLRAEGGFADYVVVQADVLARIPSDVTAVDAAALPCAGMTAYQAVVRRLHVQPGQTLVVAGGNGGVGGYSVQLAARLGAHVIALASGNAERLRSLGAAAVVDYRSPDASARILAAAGPGGLDAAIDTVSSSSATALLRLLNHGGGIACIAGRADATEVEPFTTVPSVHDIALGAAYTSGRAQHRRDLATMLQDLLQMVDQGELDPTVTHTVSLEQVPAALVTLSGRHTIGKVVMIHEDIRKAA